MPLCPSCQQPAAKRNDFDRRGRQKYACSICRRTFTEHSVSAFSGYRWPADVILTAVRWYLAYPLSSRQVVELLAERAIDVSHRTVLDSVQAFGPRLADEVRRRRRPVGRSWVVDEVFLFRKGQKRYLYRAIDEDGVVVDVLLREHRDTASAEMFFRHAIERSGVMPHEVVTDHHQPYIKAVMTACPGALHIRTGLHRVRGEMTKAVERSHVPTRDRLRNSRGLKRTETGQRFLEGFEAVRHLRRGGAPGAGHPGVWSSAPRTRSAGGGCHSYTRAQPAPAPVRHRRRGAPAASTTRQACCRPALHDFPDSSCRRCVRLALLSFGLSWHFDQDAPLMGLTLSRFRDRIQAHLERLRAGQLEAGEPLLLGGNIVEFERQPAPPRRGASAWRPHIYEYPSAIRKRLDQKLNRFAPLKDAGVPFIVAIGDAMLEQPLERAVEDVLFISSRKDRPYFSGGHTRLSAVLTCEKHNLEEGVELELRVFHNPAAANPLPPDCLPDVPQVRASPIAGGAFQTEVVGPSDGRTWLRVPSDPHHEWRRGQ